jgi:hypothetical protein
LDAVLTHAPGVPSFSAACQRRACLDALLVELSSFLVTLLLARLVDDLIGLLTVSGMVRIFGLALMPLVDWTGIRTAWRLVRAKD